MSVSTNHLFDRAKRWSVRAYISDSSVPGTAWLEFHEMGGSTSAVLLTRDQVGAAVDVLSRIDWGNQPLPGKVQEHLIERIVEPRGDA